MLIVNNGIVKELIIKESDQKLWECGYGDERLQLFGQKEKQIKKYLKKYRNKEVVGND